MNPVHILAFGAHPDDVELHCSGFLIKMKRKGYRTGVVDLTRGELSTRGTLDLRAKETRQATDILQLDTRLNLDLPDGHLDISIAHKKPLVAAIRQLKPAVVLTPYASDRHTDHIKTSQLMTEAAFLAGVKKYDPDVPPHRPERVIYYHSHYAFQPSFVVDISAEFEQKMAAIRAYASQFDSDFTNEQTFISSPVFIENLIADMRYWGAQIGTRYAEPFWIREYVRLDDPLKAWGFV